VLKIFKWIGLLAIILLIAFYFKIKNAWTDVYSAEQLSTLVIKINEAEALPSIFLVTMSEVYPGFLEKGVLIQSTQKFLTRNSNIQCPCEDLSRTININHQNRRRQNEKLYSISLAMAIEDKVEQDQCLAFYLERFDFTNGLIGIESASIYYYGKNLAKLTTEQQLELILMIKNPALYNKNKRPEIFDRELENLKIKTGYNIK